jgi:hypothetical protein
MNKDYCISNIPDEILQHILSLVCMSDSSTNFIENINCISLVNRRFNCCNPYNDIRYTLIEIYRLIYYTHGVLYHNHRVCFLRSENVQAVMKLIVNNINVHVSVKNIKYPCIISANQDVVRYVRTITTWNIDDRTSIHLAKKEIRPHYYIYCKVPKFMRKYITLRHIIKKTRSDKRFHSHARILKDNVKYEIKYTGTKVYKMHLSLRDAVREVYNSSLEFLYPDIMYRDHSGSLIEKNPISTGCKLLDLYKVVTRVFIP